MKPKKIFALAIALSFSFTNNSEEYPWLSELDYQNEVFESGERLMKLDYGLHALEQKLNNENSLIIAVHGSRSRGYEWVYPLKTLDSKNHDVYFYRWRDQGCPYPSASKLDSLIKEKLSRNEKIQKVILISHSYGGLLTSWFYENWSNNIPMEIHAIATPISGVEIVDNICGYSPPKKIKNNVSVHQWITQKNVDNAFKDLELDPQIISLDRNKAYFLPSKYKNRRLGHNWSISYVADEIIQTR